MLENLDTVIAFSLVMLLLSLLVTTLVQMVTAVLGLRGRCLLSGTEQLIKQIYPQLPDLAKWAPKIARKILTHPAVASQGRPAVAIRSRELILVLQDLAENDKDLANVKTDLEKLFTDTVGQGSPEIIAKSEELLQKLEAQFPQQAQDLKSAVEGVLGSTQSIVVKVDSWFDTVMDRTSDMFKLYTRWITIVAAVLFAFLLHVDSLAIIDQVSQNAVLRARLVEMSTAVQQEGEKVLGANAFAPATEALQSLAADTMQQDVAGALKAGCPGGDLTKCTEGLKTRQDGESWVGQHVAKDQQPKVLAAYEKTFGTVTQAHLEDLSNSLQQVQKQLADTQLVIFPQPIPGLLDFKDQRNFLGVVLAAFFLSLGAPFWYNVLRNLSDLRPIVARRVDGQPPKGAPKQGDS